MVPDRDVPGKKTTNDDYMQIAEPYDKPKPKKTKDESKKRDPWKSANQVSWEKRVLFVLREREEAFRGLKF